MKKLFTNTVTEPISLTAGVYHSKTEVVIADNPEFTQNAYYQKIVLEQNDLSVTDAVKKDILTTDIELSFPNPYKTYYKYSQVFFSDGTFDSKSRVIKITQNGTSNVYQHSEDIINTPVIEVEVGTHRDEYIIKTSPFRNYLDTASNHTSTSWKVTSTTGEVIMNRPFDSDNLTSITLAMPLETGELYHMTAIHHTGDISSNTGKYNFVKDVNETDLFELTGLDLRNVGGKDLHVIYNNIFNFAEITTLRNDMQSLSWRILDKNGIVQLTDNSIVREVLDNTSINPKSIFIGGQHLEPNTTYDLEISAEFGYSDKTQTSVKTFKITTAELNVPNRVVSGIPSLNLVTENSNVLTGNTGLMGIGRTLFFDYRDGLLSRFVLGGEFKIDLTSNNTVSLPNIIVNNGIRTQIIGSLLFVIYDTEEQVGLSIKRRTVVRRFFYDNINHEIFNPSLSNVVYLDDSVYLQPEFRFTHTKPDAITFVTVDSSKTKYILNDFNFFNQDLSDITNVEPINVIGDISVLGNNVKPVLIDLSDTTYCVIAENKTLLMDKRIANVAEVSHIGTTIDLHKWHEVISRDNGEIIMLGLSLGTTPQLTIMKFDEAQLRFVTTTLLALPDGITTRPNIIKDKNDNIAISYPAKTFILN